MTLEDDFEEKSASYQRRVAQLRPMMARAFRKGIRTFDNRMKAVLNSWMYVGGFKTRAEAEAWLLLPVSTSDIAMLLEEASKLPPEQAEKYMFEINRRAYAYRYNRQKLLKTMTKLSAASIANAILTKSTPILKKVAEEASGRTMFEMQKGVGIGFSFEGMPVTMLNRVVNSKLDFTNAKHLAESMVAPVREAMFEGILTGKPSDEISREVNKTLETADYKARAITRTMLTEVSNEAEKQTLEKTGLKKYRYVATLDERTCPVCGKLDGQIFYLKDAQAGVNFPPMHYNCRCVHTAVLTDKARANLKRRGRDAEGRDVLVPQSMTYSEWRAKFIDKP